MDKVMNDDYSVSKEYDSVDFASNYRKFLLENYFDQEEFVGESLHKIFKSGRVQGTRLLDFGCGPIVHRIASASRQFNEIVLADWSENNRKQVKKWLDGDDDALDWSLHLRQCAMREGFSDLTQGVATIEKRIRGAVQKLVPCDILSDEILPEGLGDFDAISTYYCIEACCFSSDKFKEAIRKITGYIKKGGSLVMLSVLHAKEYRMYKTIPGFYVTEKFITEALNDAGLEVRDLFIWKFFSKDESLKDWGVAVYYAVKL